jgi:hypothetical protein
MTITRAFLASIAFVVAAVPFFASASPPSAGVSCPKAGSISPQEIDKEDGWKLGAKKPGACSDKELSAFQMNMLRSGASRDASYFDYGVGLSDSCKACLISKDSDPSWQLLVGRTADNGKSGYLNNGACYAVVDGEKCGKAVQYLDSCKAFACGDRVCSKDPRCSMLAVTQGGVCRSYQEAVKASCPNYAKAFVSCSQLSAAAKTLCGK